MSKFLDEQGLSHLWSKIKLAINEAASSAQGTIYHAGTGLTLNDTTKTFSLSASGVTAGTYGDNSSTGKFLIPKVIVDTYGRITSASNTTYTAGTGIQINGSAANGYTIGIIQNTSGTSYSGEVLQIWPQVVNNEGGGALQVRIPVATTSQLGVVKIDENGYLNITSNGLLSVDADGLSSTLYGEGDGITFDNDYNISINPATNGGIKVTSAGVALNVGTGTLGVNKFNVLLESGIPKVGIGNASTSAPGLMTAAQVTALNNKANSSDVYTKAQTDTAISTAIANVNHFGIQTANSLDSITSPNTYTIYLVPSIISSSNSITLNKIVEKQSDHFIISRTSISLTSGASITDAEIIHEGDAKPLGYVLYAISGITNPDTSTQANMQLLGTLPYTNTTSNSQTIYLGIDIDCSYNPASDGNDVLGVDNPLVVNYNIGWGTSTNIDTKAEFIYVNDKWEKLGTTDNLSVDKITNSEIDTICV